MTQDLMQDEGTNAARAEFYQHGGQQPDRDGDGNPDVYWHTVGLKGYTREFIIQSSWTTTFIGSYGVEIVNNGDGTATFSIKNTTGWESGTHIPFTDYTNPTWEEVLGGIRNRDFSVFKYWPSPSDPDFPSDLRGFWREFMPTALLDDRLRSAPGPGGNMYQVYTWTEPIPVRVLKNLRRER